LHLTGDTVAVGDHEYYQKNNHGTPEDARAKNDTVEVFFVPVGEPVQMKEPQDSDPQSQQFRSEGNQGDCERGDS
jgi:hypothetical protein